MDMRRTAESGISANGLMAFAGGVLVALIASRIMPPLVAQAAGTMRAQAGRDPFDALAHDHRIILSLLDEMEHSPEHATVRRTQLLLRLKRRLAAHALAEEDVVYPLLHDQAHAVEDTRHLYAEHADMKMHLFALERMPKDDPRWHGRVGELRALIAGHVRQEEEVDFPKLRERLDQRATVRLSGSVEREKALVL
ncbi:MAG TPA: hemerythrin domain-containing protein [Azospirillum sp.]|nr:hemerythrin domain-containing protein [Azospirillum sp.]